MKTLYLDCYSGIAGDMLLGALLDLGLDQELFKKTIAGLHIGDFDVAISRIRKNGFMGTDVKVHDHHNYDEDHNHDHNHEHDHHVHEHHHFHRGFNEIADILEKSSLSETVKKRSLNAFRLLGEAEASIHGLTLEEMHFHEVGAVDSIVDIVGAFVLLEMLHADRVCASPVNVGAGTVECMHGVVPVPAPATARLLEGIPMFSKGEPMERTTPTGALLLKSLCSAFGPMPAGTIRATGYGFGDRESDLPNMLRAVLIDEDGMENSPYSTGAVAVMETNVDDMNPQDYQMLSELLFKSGALDVFFTPILMKKMRPAVRITCIAPLDKREQLGKIMLRHSTTIGVRWTETSRMTLHRKIVSFKSSLGTVSMKVSSWGSEVFHVTPEYEDLRALSQQKGIPLDQLRVAVLSEFNAKKVYKNE
jgi:uncharacterized protein (TIGR00299 family) protein